MRIFFSMVILLFTSSVLASGSILWWNIGYNNYSLPSKKNPWQQNLDDAFQEHDWKQYDIIALGEFIPDTLDPLSLSEIKEHFPFQKIIKYNNAYEKSFYIFSKRSFTTTIKDLDWVSPYQSQLEQEEYRKKWENKYGSMDRFKRKYVRITTQIGHKFYNFIFYHLNNPWDLLKKNKLKLAYQFLFVKSNPLYNQIRQLKERLKEDLGPNYRKTHTIMMGDSNCPPKVKGVVPMCYRLFKSLLPIKKDIRNADTIPAKRSTAYDKIPSVKIDHAQIGSVVKAKVEVFEDLQGSDHKALKLSILE